MHAPQGIPPQLLVRARRLAQARPRRSGKVALPIENGGKRRVVVVALLLARCARALRPAARRVVARPGRLASVAASRAELVAPAQAQQSVPVYSNEEVQTAPELPIAYDDVVIVNDVSKARDVAARLASASDRYHAVDTEVDGID